MGVECLCVHHSYKELGLSCRDVRSREIGIQEIHNKGIKPNNIELIRRDYYANNGWETFLEYGDPEQDILIGLLRLRKVRVGNSSFYRSTLVERYITIWTLTYFYTETIFMSTVHNS